MDAQATVDRVVRRLLASDLALRPTVARRLLETLGPSEAVALLDALLARARAGSGPHGQALAALGAGLSLLADSEPAAAIYAEARRAGVDAVARLLMRPAAARAYHPAQEVSVDREMRRLPLGRRKQLARAADPVVLTRLMADPDPAVARQLLGHPRLTEAEVVRMAARRPAPAEVLREIHAHPRWAVRGRVRVALANNPFTPPDLSLKLVPLLRLPELRQLLRNRAVHEEVRRAAGQRVAEAQRARRIGRASAHLDELEPEGDA